MVTSQGGTTAAALEVLQAGEGGRDAGAGHSERL